MSGAEGKENRYDLVTETTGIELTREAASMMATRYGFAASLSEGRRVLEIGCGAALGFGMMGKRAQLVVGGDYSPELLGSARKHYGDRFPFARLSAEQLPFADGVFDVILCFEMSYYIPDAKRAFQELHRILAPSGALVFVNANPERPDFIRSPYSVHYHSADEFRRELVPLGFSVAVEAAFPVAEDNGKSIARPALRIARQILETFGLVPRTIKGRARLKRLVYGRLLATPPELPENFAPVAVREAQQPGPITHHKVIYVVARKRV